MIEDYKIQFHIGRAEPTGEYEILRNGKRRRKTRFVEEIQTPAGIFPPKVWKQKAMSEIENAGELELLEQIREHCRRLPWLKNEEEIEEHAIGCLCSRAYRHWEDFKDEETIIWM